MNNAVPIGPGGGGTMFAPQISPHDSTLIFVACDMTGLYRSTDRGRTWLMCDTRQAQSTAAPGATGTTESPYGFAVAFHPDLMKSSRVLASHTRTGLMLSDQSGDDDSWTAFLPALPLNGDGFPWTVLAAGFSRDFTATTDAALLVGAHDGSVGTFALFHIESNTWKVSTYATGAAINARVIAFCFFDPSKSTKYFCATVNDVMQSTDKGRTWTSIAAPSGGLPLPAGFTVGGICSSADSLFVTVTTAAGTQGVYSSSVTGPNYSWSPMNGNLPLTAGYLYQHIASADDRDALHPGTKTLFVTVVTPGLSPPNVFRSTNGAPWQGVYDGLHNAGATPNVTPGWLDEAEPPVRRGWGFGGPAWGFTVAPSNSDVVVFVNQAVCNICENGTAAAPQWDNRYTELTSPPASVLTPSERWRTTGLDVTTVWKYFIDPSNPNVHFICYTDIGLARSDDGGQTWATITVPDGIGGIWGNYYDLISDSIGANLWAAVSSQHDIPHAPQTEETKQPIGIGTVITSTDHGATWTAYANLTGLPNGPVISLVLAGGVLYASVWGSGIYKSTPPNGAWTQVGTLSTGGTHPHCCRIDFADAAQTDLYCVVAADTTGGGFVPGGLYHLPNAPSALSTTPWPPKLSGTLETLIASLTPPGQAAWRLVPIDFALRPFPSDPPGVHYLGTADGGGRGGGGLYKYDTASNTWAPLASKPFGTAYNDGLEVFSVFFFNGVRYTTSATHGTWFSGDNGTTWEEYKASNFLRSQRILFPKLDTTTGLIAGDPSSAPFYISTYGGSAMQVPRGLFVMLELATVVESSVVVGAWTPHAFYVVFENFLAAETGAGIQNPVGGLTYTQAPQISFIDTASGLPISGMQANLTPVLSIDDSTLLTDTPQRFLFEYQLKFTDVSMFAAAGSKTVTLQARLGPYACSAEMVLLTTAVPSPQMDNLATSWLSDALRVFHVAENQAPYLGGPVLTFNAGDTPQSAALRFLGILQSTLNGTPSLFSNFSTAETSLQSTLYWHQMVGGIRQYNFALARVQANPLATNPANNVQVFFRLFTTAVSYTSFDPVHSYRRAQQPGSTVETPLLGVEPPAITGTTDVRIATIPCFGSPRLDYSQQSTAAQTDGVNQAIVPVGGTVFFGCWLDINQLDPRYPVHPTDDGPFAAGSMKTIQELIRGNHQCLVAEIFSPQSDSIKVGLLPPAGPGPLAQRNLSIDESNNPGESADSRTVSHTFEIGWLQTDVEGGALRPDDLMIEWGNVPVGARAELFLPEVDAYQSARLAARHSGSKRLRALDAHTLQCAVGGVTFVPVVRAEPRRTRGLMTVELPAGVEAGQVFRIVVRQVSGDPRRIVGMFQFLIPVRKTVELLPDEARKLGVLRWMARSLVAGDSWTPVIALYQERVVARVLAFGGNPAAVPPSPYGAPGDGPAGCLPGWLVAILRALGFGG